MNVLLGHGVLSCDQPDVVACKVYFPDEDQIQVHQTSTTLCPTGFHNEYYWYGKKQASPGRYPSWIDDVLDEQSVVKNYGDISSNLDTTNDPDITSDLDATSNPDTISDLDTISDPDATSDPDTNGIQDSPSTSSEQREVINTAPRMNVGDGDTSNANVENNREDVPPVRDRLTSNKKDSFRKRIYRPKRYL